eukprot:jgi/Galph1/2941/GphlegSOOS_G1632.1
MKTCRHWVEMFFYHNSKRNLLSQCFVFTTKTSITANSSRTLLRRQRNIQRVLLKHVFWRKEKPVHVQQTAVKTRCSARQDSIRDELYRIGLVVCIRLDDFFTAWNVCKAVLDGGVNSIEITLDTPNAFKLIEMVCTEYPNAVIGAGTVLTSKQTREAAQSGAKFIMSPLLIQEVLMETQKQNLVSIPGAITPAEVYRCYAAGASIIKLFPVECFGGLSLVKTLAGPFPQIPLLPTSGIDISAFPNEAPDYREELTDLMPGVVMRGWRASSQEAFQSLQTPEENHQLVSTKLTKVSLQRDKSLATRILATIVALQVSSLKPYLRNGKGVQSASKEILLCCIKDEKWFKTQLLRYGFKMEVTLAILTLACMYHREAILPYHIAEKAAIGEIPYLDVCSKLPERYMKHNAFRKLFNAHSFPSAFTIRKEARNLLTNNQHCWPPLYDFVGNFLTSSAGYVDFPCSCSYALAGELTAYFSLPHSFLEWMYIISTCRRISQEKRLEPCGELDVLCDLFNVVKISLAYQVLKKHCTPEVAMDEFLCSLGLSLPLHVLFRTLCRLKMKKSIYYRLYHNDWKGIDHEDIEKLAKIYENIVLVNESVPHALLPVVSSLRHLTETTPSEKNGTDAMEWEEETESWKQAMEENAEECLQSVCMELIALGLSFLGHECTEKLIKYVIQTAERQLNGILILIGVIKPPTNESYHISESHDFQTKT